MYNRVEDQQYNPPPYQQIIPQTYQPQQLDATSLAIQHIQIPDQVNFEHIFEYSMPCCFGVEKQKSHFQIDGIGRLELGYEANVCCCPMICATCCFACCLQCVQCNVHTYPTPDYVIQNENVRMEYWQEGIGKIKVKGQQVLDFLQTHPNLCDLAYSHCQSAYPQIKVTRTLDPNSRPYILTPDPSPLPENCFSPFTVLSCLGIGNLSRQFHVEGLTQGRCVIENSRNCQEAFAKISGCQGFCCLPHVDYPNFTVSFENVLPIDKLGILMGLVNYCIIKKWFILTRVTHTFAGEA